MTKDEKYILPVTSGSHPWWVEDSWEETYSNNILILLSSQSSGYGILSRMPL